MRTLPQALQDHLASGATTLCHCWRLETRAGEVMGFTDHDRDLFFEDTLFEADAGFTATEIDSSLGLSVDNLEASGALSSARISETRLAAGDFDNAAIALWRVNWHDVNQRVLLKRGNLGEVTRGKDFFVAELRGLAHVLDQPMGRLFQHGCDAVLGDQRCGVALAGLSVAAQVTACLARVAIQASGAQGFVAGYFSGGTVKFLTGPNAGRLCQIKAHRLDGVTASLDLWQALPSDAQQGDQMMLTPGCDRQLATCRDKFANAVNFRGFPHMPGDDAVMRYALRTKRSKK